MATDPIPEPLTNQQVKEEDRPGYPVAGSSALSPDVRVMPPALPPADGKPGASGRVEQIKSRVSDVADQAQHTVAEVKDRVADAAGQAKEKVADTYEKAKVSASRGYDQASRRSAELIRTARIRSRQIVHDYPFQVIAGAAAAGFLAGVILRIWRSNRYE